MVDDKELRDWFCREVLPLERPLTRFIRRNYSRIDDVVDIRQEVYAAALKGAHREVPTNTSAYIFAIARNNLINRSRRDHVVSFELAADIDALGQEFEIDDLDRHLLARDELRRALKGIRQLPARCAQVVHLRKVEGYSTKETADHLGVTTHTVERQLTLGMRALADYMLGGSGRVRRELGRTNAKGRQSR